MTPRSICFVSLSNFAALAGAESAGPQGRTLCPGGAEVQQMHIAHGLRDRGHDVSFITYDHGQPDGAEIDGIRVYHAFDRKAGLPGMRFWHPRWTGLCAAMRRADAQIYIQRTASSESGQVCRWCRAHGKRFVFSVASDSDVDPKLPWLAGWLERSLYRYGLRHADGVVVQTQQQRRMLADAFNRSAVMISSCKPIAPLDPDRLALPPGPTGRPAVLWVGRFVRAKRPEWCLAVAARCPQFDFHLVGGSVEENALSEHLRYRADVLSNVILHGPVPYNDMSRFYQDCHVLLCTSSIEGFPNTFLEAWSHGRPVVGSVDPDGVVTKFGLGLVGQSARELAESLTALLSNQERWAQVAKSAYQYVCEHHSLDGAVTAYERLFDSLGAESESHVPAAHARMNT